MAIRYPLVLEEDGQIAELPSGDSLPASSSASYASQILYDPSISGYPNNVQGAIDQIYLTQDRIFGGVITLPNISRNGNGSVTIDAGAVVNFYVNSNGQGEIKQISSISGATLTPTDATLAVAYLAYNSGNPTWNLTTDQSIFFTNGQYVAVFRLLREGTWVHIIDYDQYGTALANKSYFKDIALHNFERQSGLILSTYDTRKIKITSGLAWFGVTSYQLTESDSASTNFFEYKPTAGVFAKTQVTEYDSTTYSDGTNTLTLSNNKWSARYYFRSVGSDNEVFCVYGNQHNTEALAIVEAIPSLPFVIPNHAVYVGKIVVQQGAAIGTAYPRVWEGAVAAAPINYHNDLNGLQLADTGVTYGHISDATQNIYGQKNFRTRLLVGTDAWDTVSAFQVLGNVQLGGRVGIGGAPTVNAALRIYNSVGLSTTDQVGIKNYFQPTAEATAYIQGYESNPAVPVGVTSNELRHFSLADELNLGNIAAWRGIIVYDLTKTYSASAVAIRSYLNTKAYPALFIAHSGTAPSQHVGNFILGSTDVSDGWSKLQLTGNTKYTGFETYAKSQLISASIVLPASSVTRCYDSCEVAAGITLEIPAGAILYIE